MDPETPFSSWKALQDQIVCSVLTSGKDFGSCHCSRTVKPNQSRDHHIPPLLLASCRNTSNVSHLKFASWISRILFHLPLFRWNTWIFTAHPTRSGKIPSSSFFPKQHFAGFNLPRLFYSQSSQLKCECCKPLKVAERCKWALKLFLCRQIQGACWDDN